VLVEGITVCVGNSVLVAMKRTVGVGGCPLKLKLQAAAPTATNIKKTFNALDKRIMVMHSKVIGLQLKLCAK